MEKDLKIRISIDKKTGAVKVIGSEFDTLDNKIKKTEKSASSLERTFLKYVSIGAVLYGVKQGFDAALYAAKQFINTADDMVLVSSRLSLVTESTEEFARAQQELLTISNNARTSIRATTDLYTQLNRSTRELGLSQNDLLQVTDTVSKTLAISGASAQAADAALLQLSQGMASGVLRGEELNSVLEQAPRLAQAIANGMGVSIGQLRTLGADGQLTAQKVLAALQSQSEVVNAEFSKIAINAQSGYTVLNNYIDTTVAKANEQYKVTQTVGQVYIAFGQAIETIFNQLDMGWDTSSDKALWFANTTADVVVSFINGMGYAYDVLETLSDEFNILRYAGESAFYGIQVVSSNVANAIVSTFEYSFNMVIDGINNVINWINGNSFGMISIPNVGKVDFGSDRTGQRVEYVEAKFDKALSNLSNAVSNVFNGGEGQAWASEIASTFRGHFDTLIAESQKRREEQSSNNSNAIVSNPIVNTPASTPTVVTPVSNTNTPTTIYDDIVDSNTQVTDSINDTVDAVTDLNTSLGDDGTYTVVTNTGNKVDNLNDTLRDTGRTAQTAQRYIFQFSDTLLNTFSSNADSLLSVVNSSSSIIQLTYEDALVNMESAKAALQANPLDKDIGIAYANAYNSLVDSSSLQLDKSNFSSSNEYKFAQASVLNQLESYQNAANAGYSVLDSMNDFLEAINQSFEDGILTDAEKQTISGVADTVNANNDVLLGTSGAVASAVTSQEYYNNSDVVNAVGSQEYFNNTDIVSAVGSQEYYNNTNLARTEDLTANTTSVTSALLSVNKSVGNIKIDDFDTTPITMALNGESQNSVTGFIQKLMGDNNSGISLNSISSSLPDLSVNTGLDIDELATSTDILGNTKAVNNSNIKGNSVRSLDNLRVKQELTITKYEGQGWKYDRGTGNYTNTYGKPTGDLITGQATSYTYYAEGGFTGKGYGAFDHTGFRPAGIVHEDEWVAPKWMLKQNPSTFEQLENIRQKGSFAKGGYTSTKVNLSSEPINANIALENELSDLKKLAFSQTQQLIKLNRTIMKLSNGGQALLVEGV